MWMYQVRGGNNMKNSSVGGERARDILYEKCPKGNRRKENLKRIIFREGKEMKESKKVKKKERREIIHM